MKKEDIICYVCKKEIDSRKYVILPKSNKYPFNLHRHNKCYPFSEKFIKHGYIGSSVWKKFINEKKKRG